MDLTPHGGNPQKGVPVFRNTSYGPEKASCTAFELLESLIASMSQQFSRHSFFYSPF